MFESAGNHAHPSIKAFVLAAVVGMIVAEFGAPGPITPASAQYAIPELASSSFAWQVFGADWRDPLAGLRGRSSPNPSIHAVATTMDPDR
jgi:hypothetical protein